MPLCCNPREPSAQAVHAGTLEMRLPRLTPSDRVAPFYRPYWCSPRYETAPGSKTVPHCHNKVWCFLKYRLPLISSNLWGIFWHREGNKTAGCSGNSWSNSWHPVFIIGNGSYIIKSDSNGETEWCNGCYVLVVGVSRVGFLVRFPVQCIFLPSTCDHVPLPRYADLKHRL